MMDNQKAYDQWSDQYDSNTNRTRDLEAVALRTVLNDMEECDILEIGCGTGKNTAWLITKAKFLLAVDFSSEMMAKARAKFNAGNIQFRQADITQPWTFCNEKFDLIIFSLVLEHVEDLQFIFQQSIQKLKPGGKIYIGELHPYKQVNGSKARFETKEGITVLNCFNHTFKEYTGLAQQYGFLIEDMQEWHDEEKKYRYTEDIKPAVVK